MKRSGSEIALDDARRLLGVTEAATAAEIRRAYLTAAKIAHPDVAGGASERFIRVMAAYRRLEAAAASPAPSPRPDWSERPVLEITPLVAWAGGGVDYSGPGGRLRRIRLPPGLRNGDSVRAGDVTLEVCVVGCDDMQVRGDDLWMTLAVPPRMLSEGGRLPVVTPIGRRILWITRKAGARRLLRVPGLGLPACGEHPQGCLFVRLAPKAGPLDSAARTLLRRFVAAWAA